MLKLCVLVSGGGTNLQAIIDAIECGKIQNTEISLVISSRRDAYALERAKNHGIKSLVIRKRDFESQELYEKAMTEAIKAENCELLVLAGFMSIVSENFVRSFPKKIINIHPSLIPSFCGEGFYGLKTHSAAISNGFTVMGATLLHVAQLFRVCVFFV